VFAFIAPLAAVSASLGLWISPKAGTVDFPPAVGGVVSLLAFTAVELLIVALSARVLYSLAKIVLRRVAIWTGELTRERRQRFKTSIRHALVATSLVFGVGIVLYNAQLAVRGIDARAHTLDSLRGISVDSWIGWLFALIKTVAIAAFLFFASRFIRQMLARLEQAINRWDGLRDNDRSLNALFAGLARATVVAGWMLLAVSICWLFAVPPAALQTVLLAFRIYVVIAISLAVIRSSVVIVDTLEGLGHKYAEYRGWLKYYNHLRPLTPTFSACLEYGLWIMAASLVVVQLEPIHDFAVWGPRLVQAIGIFFLGRVAIELGLLEISRRMLPAEGLDDATRRRRATMAPLVQTAFVYGGYFIIAVLILGSLGFNPLPFLAGAGILGLVIGFGAQSLINDVVSGFFVLFEDTYLVGDTIETGSAKGMVEGIDFRTTRIRDSDGRLHILRNGDIKEVINYSKEYTLAVVPVRVPYEADLRRVFATLQEAGKQVHAEHPDVLSETQIDGITVFGTSSMTVRTSTRVLPGRHEAVAAALRLAIKEAFDQQNDSQTRKGLVA
jgi:moderate conductance mechanosensitive channel